MEHPTDAMRRTIAEQHDEIAALRAENDQLVMKLNAEHIVRQNVERENAKLREEFDKMDVWHSKELSAAMAEIDKLRELVRDMYACIKALCSMVENSPGCSMCLTNQDEEKPCAAADVYCRMRELGVEV